MGTRIGHDRLSRIGAEIELRLRPKVDVDSPHSSTTGTVLPASIDHPVGGLLLMPFSTRTSDVGVFAGHEHGLRRLIVRVQPVAPDEVAHLHRHDDADQILSVLQGQVAIEVDGESRICRPGEMAIAPAGSAHGFRGTGVAALLEVIGEQARGTVFLLADGEEIEVHRPGVPWDRPGTATDMSALDSRMLPPRLPSS